MRAATIIFGELQVRLLFEGGYYSGCGFYSNKYGKLFTSWVISRLSNLVDGKVFNLSMLLKITKFKTRQKMVNTYAHMAHSIQIAKFKIHQYHLGAVLPLAKVSRYTVHLYYCTQCAAYPCTSEEVRNH